MEYESTPWKGYFPPHRIFGNLYFVGTYPASTHIIDTGDGLIMIDSGYMHSLYLVLSGMEKLGLSPRDIKYILHTHGHIDHMGGTKALVELYGAKTFIGKEDREYANGALDLSYAKELGMEYTAMFEPDALLSDGDRICLGNTEFTCAATPGHTPGAMSFFFEVTDGTERLRAGLHGGMGLNTMCRAFLDKYGLSYDCRDAFIKGQQRLQQEEVDIFLGNHMQHNHTDEKYKKLQSGDRYAYVNKTEWSDCCAFAINNLKAMLADENKG